MTNELTFGFGAGLPSRAEMAARGLNNAAMAAPRVGGDKQYLKMDPKSGEWIYGQDETLVEPDSLWAINPLSLQYGYVAWAENSSNGPEGEVMVPVTMPLPAMNTLRVKGTADGQPSKGAGAWQFQQSVDIVGISGEDAGVACQYKNSTNGAMKLFHTLSNALSPRLADAEEMRIVPIITMSHESYKNKKFGGRTLNPIWTIVEWRTMEDTSPPAEAVKETPKPADPPRSRMPRGTPVPEIVDNDPLGVEEAMLAREYAAEQEAAAANPVPRRRVRR